MTVNWLQCASDGEKPLVAIAVVPDNHEHTGIVYRDGDDRFMFLHLAFHCILRRESVPVSHYWVLPSDKIHPSRLAHVAEMCERIWARNRENGIPYGFRYDASTFRRDGAIVLGPNERGFTCSTFVLAVFRHVGVEVLQRDEWPVREDDEARFEKLLKLLRKHCQDEAHIKAVSAETKSIRYRALEVAGGSHHSPSASFANASDSAGHILRHLVLPFFEQKARALNLNISQLLDSDCAHSQLDKWFEELDGIHSNRTDILSQCETSHQQQATEEDEIRDESIRLRARYGKLKSA